MTLLITTPTVDEKSTSILLNQKYKDLCDYDSKDLKFKFTNHPSNGEVWIIPSHITLINLPKPTPDNVK
jgi:hypothetical protein